MTFGTLGRKLVSDDSGIPYSFQTLCIIAALGYFFISNEISKQPSLLWVPESAIIILLGLMVTLIMTKVDSNFEAEFQTEFFFQVLLAPIIFASGFKIDLKVFYDNLSTIMLFANVGTVLNILIFGATMYGLGNGGLSTKLTFTESMSFGSVISATDPVTTVAIFDHLQVEPALYVIVVAVSILDDAVSIIMFNMYNEFITDSGSGSSVSHSTSYYIWACVSQFLWIFVGSLAIGYALGAVFALLLRRRSEIATDNAVLFHMMVLAGAYLSYSAADSLQLSGITSAMFAGVSMQRYLKPFVAAPTMNGVTHSVSFVAQAFETAVFLTIGTSLLQNTPSSSGGDWAFVAWSMVMCLLSRAAQVYPLSWMLNAYHGRPVMGNDTNSSSSSSRGGEASKSDAVETQSILHSSTGFPDLESGSAHGADMTDSSSASQQQSNALMSMMMRNRSSSRTELIAHSEDSASTRGAGLSGSGSSDSSPAKTISTGYMHVMFVAGLRGPIAYATGKLFPDTLGHQNLVAAASSMVMLGTILVFGPLTIPTLRLCGIQFGAQTTASADDACGNDGDDAVSGDSASRAASTAGGGEFGEDKRRRSGSASAVADDDDGDTLTVDSSSSAVDTQTLLGRDRAGSVLRCTAVWQWVEALEARFILSWLAADADEPTEAATDGPSGDDSLLTDCEGVICCSASPRTRRSLTVATSSSSSSSTASSSVTFHGPPPAVSVHDVVVSSASARDAKSAAVDLNIKHDTAGSGGRGGGRRGGKGGARASEEGDLTRMLALVRDSVDLTATAVER